MKLELGLTDFLCIVSALAGAEISLLIIREKSRYEI